tara:strand:- start:90518 stop:90706 length:189 start_codon:yes stop_codon:yes gene_type:complete
MGLRLVRTALSPDAVAFELVISFSFGKSLHAHTYTDFPRMVAHLKSFRLFLLAETAFEVYQI